MLPPQPLRHARLRGAFSVLRTAGRRCVRPARYAWAGLCACVALLAIAGCGAPAPAAPPAIEFTQVPSAAEGGSERLASIAGRVTGAQRGQRVVLLARSGVWWVQPFVDHPFTEIGADGRWTNTIHLGTEYAALVVDATYRPLPTFDHLPPAGGAIAAVRVVSGTVPASAPPRHVLSFSGYEWHVRDVPSDRGGANAYDPANAWTDAGGALHLRLAQRGGVWTSAEVSLARPLGYGTYLFVVRDTSRLDPSAAFTMFTWDIEGVEQNHREIDVEISRWGVPASKNAQYVVQPYYVAQNVMRFAAPAGRVTHAWRWEPGRAAFWSVRGAPAGGRGPRVAEHEFSTGVPSPGNETVHMNLYYFRHARTVPRQDVEVVIEKFQYLP